MISIAFVKNRTSGVVKSLSIDWSRLSERLARCDIGDKDGSGWMPADIELGQRTAERVKSVSALVFDCEAKAETVEGEKKIIGPEPPAPDAMLAEVVLSGWRCILHTSYNHTAEHPRYRLTFDLARPLAPEEVKPLGLYVAAILGIADCIDTGCLEPARLFYLPRCAADRKDLFRHAETKGIALPVDELLAEAAQIDAAQKSVPRRTGQSGNVIEAFNNAHDVAAILEKHGYAMHGKGRWLWPGSTTGLAGVRLLPAAKPQRVYSSHGGDPLNDGHAHDAFDVFRILAHSGEMSAAVKDAARICGVEHSRAPVKATHQPGDGSAPAGDPDGWPEPQPLPDGLPGVAQFDFALLPETLQPWARDICERVQCPPDYVAVTIMAALGAVIGRKVGIRPQERTDWIEYPNQWALCVGRPGVLKSPAMEAALSPLKRLAVSASETYHAAIDEYERGAKLAKLRAEAGEKAAKAKLVKNSAADVSGDIVDDELEAPTLKRYIANDTSAESLGELLRQNPNGLLVFRDELVSLLKGLDREENAPARGFYLTGWNGNSPYVFDRIGRGLNLHIPAVCLSMLGSTQPGRIAEYLRAAVKGGAGDDGMIQRFGLLVWPDTDSTWCDVDRWPDTEARHRANAVFEKLDMLDAEAIGTQCDDFDKSRYLRFDGEGLALFREWREGWELKVRGGDLHPALESHLAKYRKLVPALALVLHLANDASGPVSGRATLQALAWAEYLETHARRAYASVTSPETSAAKAIIEKLRKGELPRTFAARDIYRRGWAHLSERERVQDALRLLCDLDWLAVHTRDTEGRTATFYEANPKGFPA